MKKGLVIADAGPIFSLAIIDKLELLNEIFDDIKIPRAVWHEITLDKKTTFYGKIHDYFEHSVLDISGFNELTLIMDYGESEAVLLYKELNAQFLLIDDKKARNIAENFDIKCVGTLGLLSMAREKELIDKLKPLFETLLNNDRYYSINLLNKILDKHNEAGIKNKA